ncbi:MAG: hypothetical protein C5B47_04515 [Verrucomicrobia bacterium]|nr:MAG: hypothetical protein C5B47_04515 [Verrucomicrobiota bacterium]
MTILDRYVLKRFFMPFFYCITGFVAIWFIFDLSDNIPIFLQGRASLLTVLRYYQTQLPAILVLALPAGTLLALLYSLTMMSRSNEVISMLTAGRSVLRVLSPLFLVGLILVGIITYFNWSSAPHAERIKKQMLNDIRKRTHTDDEFIAAHMYRNREYSRLWFMSSIAPDQINNLLENVQIIQQNQANEITQEWFANNASYDETRRAWILKGARYVELDPRGNILKSVDSDRLTIEHWNETPWRIASSVMNPDYLSVSELNDYLLYNKDFPERRLAPYRTHLQYRYALPWQVMVAVTVGGALGIVYSRRGILGGVGAAIGIFFTLIFVDKVFIAMGKGNHVNPVIAAWTPLVFYSLVGCWLLWIRSTGREFPKLKLPGF